MSNFVQKVKDALGTDQRHNDTTGPATAGPATGTTGTTGPHKSDLLNKLDPRVDTSQTANPNVGVTQEHHTSVEGDTHAHSGVTNTGTTAAYNDPSHPHTATTGPATKTDGPHNSNLVNKADPRVDSDRDASRNLGANPQRNAAVGSNTHTHAGITNTGTTTTTTTTAFNDPSHPHTATRGPATSTDGPHNSNLLNKADPRVDSDRDASRNLGANPQRNAAVGSNTHTHAGITNTGTTTAAYNDPAHPNVATTGPASGTDGPHNSNLLNKLDPRVDSDRDASRNLGAKPERNAAVSGSNVNTGSGFATTGIAGANSGAPEGTYGPHGSRISNTADPRVDSDRDNRAAHQGFGTTGTYTAGSGTGLTGATHTQTTAGHHHSSVHGSHAANVAGPRLEADRDVRSAHHTGPTTHTGGGVIGGGFERDAAASATGPAPNTAGPHSSDLMNKADPRVDSNLDGSKTVGGQKTFDQSGISGSRKDPTDPTQVPPSVLQRHVGEPRPLN